MSVYKVAYWLKRNRQTQHETEPTREIGKAIQEANSLVSRCSVITILRDSEGADHPDNAGKFFLDRIVK